LFSVAQKKVEAEVGFEGLDEHDLVVLTEVAAFFEELKKFYNSRQIWSAFASNTTRFAEIYDDFDFMNNDHAKGLLRNKTPLTAERVYEHILSIREVVEAFKIFLFSENGVARFATEAVGLNQLIEAASGIGAEGEGSELSTNSLSKIREHFGEDFKVYADFVRTLADRISQNEVFADLMDDNTRSYEEEREIPDDELGICRFDVRERLFRLVELLETA